jgi:DNA repair exonuclease SbcCD ATPase subunit
MNELREKHNRFLNKKNEISSNIKLLKEKQKKFEKLKLVYEKSHAMLVEAARMTREEFKSEVENLADLVIGSVFRDRDFKFELHFYEKRKQLECQPLIIEGDEIFEPEEELGGSTLDIVGIAFRLILWSMGGEERSRAVFAWDEPARYVGGENVSFLSEIISELSSDLDLQFILTTHNRDLKVDADKVYNVKYLGKPPNGISEVKEEGEKIVNVENTGKIKRIRV